MQVVIAPTKFWLPSSTSAGPKRICFSDPVVPTLMRVPRGRFACGVAMPQWYPHPGASCALANALPTITESAPQASALQTSPPLLIPPSVMIGTCFLRDPAEFSRALGNGTNRGQHTAVFDLAYAARD